MHPALSLLLRLRIKAAVRRMLRMSKSPRGIVFTIIGGLLLLTWIGAWLGPLMLPTLLRKELSVHFGIYPDTLRTFGPAALFLMCVYNALARMRTGALYFSPAEISFLFPAPIPRVKLLIYKLVGVGAGSLGAGIFFAMVFSNQAQSVLAALIGITLAMLFANLVAVLAALANEHMLQPGTGLLRSIVALFLGLLAAAFVITFLTLPPFNGFLEGARAVLTAPLVLVVFTPLRTFMEVATAESYLELAGWSIAGILLNVLIFMLLVRLDALNLESALHSSARVQDLIDRAQRNHTATDWKGAARLRIPMLPHLKGAGAIAWRQMTTALRTSRGLFIGLAILIVLSAAAWLLLDTDDHIFTLPVLGWLGAMLTFHLIWNTQFDFRGELQQLEWLKTLPISGTALVIGQFITPVFVLTTVQGMLLTIFGLALDVMPYVLPVAAFLLPVNLILVGMENAFFLLYPTRQNVAGFDLQSMGRGLVFFVFRIVLLAAWFGLAAGAGMAVMLLLKGSLTALFITAWIVLAGTCWLVIPMTARAFARFDVSLHMPA